MGNQIVELSNARKGLVVGEDIFVNSLYPIIRKDTILTPTHLDVLKDFGVKEFMVKTEVVGKKGKLSINQVDIVSPPKVRIKTFEDYYVEAVQEIKKEYTKWRAGIIPDVTKVRAIIFPLVDQAEQPGLDLSFLTRISTTKDYLYHHAIAVGLLSFIIARKMKLTTGEAVQLSITGVLMDCGMVKVPPRVVNKTHRLTDNDYAEIKKHPVYSYQMVKDTPLLKVEMKLSIFQHHERLDGSGYPKREKGKNISIYAQILSVADVYHARTCDRIYQLKESPYKVLEAFREDYEKFNPEVINALYTIVGNLSIGTIVELSSGEIGSVIYHHQNEPFRPSVKLQGDGMIIDLTKHRQLTVERIVEEP